jgi:hypothetical protein
MAQEAPPPAARREQTVLWVIAVLLGMIAAGLWTRDSGNILPAALAQSQGSLAGARGIFAFSGQIDQNRYGLFMLDVDQGTVWCYEIEPGAGVRKLRLVAARTFIYDRYLKDFNCAEPSFRMVEQLVAQQRSDVSAAPDAATVDPPLDGNRP